MRIAGKKHGEKVGWDEMEKHSIIEQCRPCLNHGGEFCNSYLYPEAKWRNYDLETGGNRCPMFRTELVEKKRRQKIKAISPTKQKKKRKRE